MKIKLYILSLLASVALAGVSQEDLFMSVGGEANDAGFDIAMNPLGEILVAANSRSYGNGSDDYLFIRLDADFNIVEQYTWGSIFQDRVKSLISTSDGGYASFGESWQQVYGREDMHLVKFDSEGQHEWETFYGGSESDHGFDIIEVEGGYALLGYSSSFGGSIRGNFLLTRVNTKGELLWQRNYGTEYNDHGFSLLAVETGGFWLLGSTGGFYNLARADFTRQDADILLIRVDKDGNELFRRTIGGPRHDWARDMLAVGGEIYILGSTQSEGEGSFDMYLVKIDSDGKTLWTKTMGGEDFEYGEAMQLTPSGDLYLLGTSASGNTNHDPDIYLLRVNSSGDIIWEQRFGTIGPDYGRNLIVLPDSGCLLGGTLSVHPGMHTNVGLIRVDQNGTIMNVENVSAPQGDPRVRLYPNPTTTSITISFEGLKPGQESALCIYSLSGQLVFEKNLTGSDKQHVLLSDLPAGAFIYQITGKGTSFTGKLIIQQY